MKKISVFAIKGGIGKTTVTLTLGLGLSGLGKKVLLVDQDLNTDLSYRMLGEELTQYSIFSKDKHGVGSIAIATSEFMPTRITDNIDLLPMEPDAIVKADQRLITSMIRIPEKYDYVIFDTPPSYDAIVAENIMKQSDYIFSVVAPAYPVIRTLQIELLKLIPRLVEDLRRPPAFVGIIKNMLHLTRGEEMDTMMNNLEESCKTLSIKHYTPCLFSSNLPMRGRIYNYDKIRTILLTSTSSKIASLRSLINATTIAQEFEARITKLDETS